MERNKYTSSDFKVDMSNLEFAPIVVFAYIRPKKLEKLIISLKKNAEFKNSKVIFYVDKYKDESEKKKNLEVISVIKNYCNNLNYEINHNKKNLGLKNNILNGINKSLKKYNRAIFLEDDLLVSNNFLKYMNEALNMYSDKKEVKHISGYNYPYFLGKSKSSYFNIYMNCWGWATWADRWRENNNYSNNLISNLPKADRLRFTVYGLEKDFESQLIRNQKKEIETWAIYWMQHIFLSGGFCLNPNKTLVQNTGDDNTSVHGTSSKIYTAEINNKTVTDFPKKISFKNFNKLQIMYFYYTKRLKKKYRT